MQNRRWHLRLHYNCFIGSDMTSWLLDNFDDLEDREEAEALGNRLMVSDDDRGKESSGKDGRRDNGVLAADLVEILTIPKRMPSFHMDEKTPVVPSSLFASRPLLFLVPVLVSPPVFVFTTTVLSGRI